MVARHGEFGLLLPEGEVPELRLFGEFVAQSESVVVEPEAHDQHAALLFERDGQFVVVVADRGRFSPYGLPGLVERAPLRRAQRESVQQRGGVFELEAQPAGKHYRAVLVGEGVARNTVRNVECQGQQMAGRGEDLLRGERSQNEQTGKDEQQSLHEFSVFSCVYETKIR